MLIKLDLPCRVRKKGLVKIGLFMVGAQCRKGLEKRFGFGTAELASPAGARYRLDRKY